MKPKNREAAKDRLTVVTTCCWSLLLDFGEGAVLDLIDRETDAFSITLGVKLDLANRGFDRTALERLS
jgi:hypothetical protein